MTTAEPGLAEPTLRDGTAPRHDGGTRRVIVSPGAVRTFDGTAHAAPVVVRVGKPDGSQERVVAGTALLGTVDAAAEAVRERRPAAVWVTDRSYLLDCWTEWTVEEAESRLRRAAADADAELVAWTGRSGSPDAHPEA